MRFIDEAIITVQSGNGGRGCVSFRRERFIPKGGPDGGDGGCGGDVILRADKGGRTLYDFQFQKHFKAKNGGYGQGRQKKGAQGDDLLIKIPLGTMVYDADNGDFINDFSQVHLENIVAKGGQGGQGNKRFTSSTQRSPRFAQPGEPGMTRRLKLELKLIADVGLMGLPNAGKSTLISTISSAKPKIGAYPFTTLNPNLGVVQVGDAEPFVAVDIPGLISGASQGAGLGLKFLRHLERTHILVHLIDASTIDPDDPLKAYQNVNHELRQYSQTLAQKMQIVVLNKMDLPETKEAAQAFTKALGQIPVLVSAATCTGLQELKIRMLKALT